MSAGVIGAVSSVYILGAFATWAAVTAAGYEPHPTAGARFVWTVALLFWPVVIASVIVFMFQAIVRGLR